MTHQYETGLAKYYDGQNFSVLMCLSRAWYAKGTRDQSFASMKTALRHAQQVFPLVGDRRRLLTSSQAQNIAPSDKSIRYNIAVIEQKASELVFSLPVSKRTLEELKEALEYASHAQSLLSLLSQDNSPVGLPYDRDMAQQRHQYGTALLRKGSDQVTQQEKYEAEHEAQLHAAREIRMAEKAAAEAREASRSQVH